MEQFRQLGEVLGSLRALMVLRDEIDVNHRQCCVMLDALNLAFDAIAEEIKSLLRFDYDNLTKWKSLELPLMELRGIFQEGEQYVRRCLEPPRSSLSWWGKAAALNQNADCVELHLHNLLWCVPVVIEAIENAAEAAGSDEEEAYKRRILVSKKYEREWMEPKLFQHNLGKPYLSSEELCSRFNSAWKEDQWILSETIAEKKKKNPSTDLENRIADLLLDPKGKPFPSSILLGSPDFRVRGRIGSTNSNIEAVEWMGESFALKRINGDLEPLTKYISLHSSISHPNVMNCMYSLADVEKKEGFMVMELMSKDLNTHIKEICSSTKAPFPLLVAVDTMLQITRGMEYLHSKRIYHGDLNPSNIFVKPRHPNSPDCGYLHVKIAGLWTSQPAKNSKVASTPDEEGLADPCIWYAPEVLSEQEKSSDRSSASQRTDKADIYSFAMICFELLTGKVPFEDNHLQGDKMSKNIRAGKRPLFPSQSPKLMTNLTKRCWHADPKQRPSFPSICRVLRYTKRFLVLASPQVTAAAGAPPVDYFELESSLCRRLAGWSRRGGARASEVPFQMYAFRVLERKKIRTNVKDNNNKDWESGSEAASVCGDENDGVSMSSSSSSSSSSTATGKTLRPVGVERGENTVS